MRKLGGERGKNGFELQGGDGHGENPSFPIPSPSFLIALSGYSLTEGDATNTKLEAPENQIKLHLLSSVSIHFSSFYQDKFGSPFQIIDGLTFSTLNLTTHFIKNLYKISFLLLWFVLSIQILQKMT